MAMQLYQGWPYDGTITDNWKIKAEEGVVAGMAVKKDSEGRAIKCTGASGELVAFAMEDQSCSTVAFANSLAVSVSNYILYTDQYIAGVYTQDDALEIVDGKWQKHSGGGKPIAAYYDGAETLDGIPMIRIKKFN